MLHQLLLLPLPVQVDHQVLYMFLIFQIFTQFSVRLNSNSISYIINGKSRNLQKLLKYFNGTTTSLSNILLLFGVLPISFVLYSKDYLLFFVAIYPIISIIIFILTIIHFIPTIIPQASLCHRIIATIF